MNTLFTIVDKKDRRAVTDTLKELALPLSVVLYAHGTAPQDILDLLGIEEREKRVIVSVANEEKSREFIRRVTNKLYIGVPGHGIIVSVPIKSIGGGNTVAYLSEEARPAPKTPSFSPDYELIVAIANTGFTDPVMKAARGAGATGGTVVHGMGTGAHNAKQFLNVSLASEKEVILIVAGAKNKAAIMRAVLEEAGPATKAGTVVFSLPTSAVAGFGLFGQEEETEEKQ